MKRNLFSAMRSDLKNAFLQVGLANKTLLNRIPFVSHMARKAYYGMRTEYLPKDGNESFSSTDELKDVSDVRASMNERYASREFYSIACLWDQVREQELSRRVFEFSSPANEKEILDLGSGVGGYADSFSDCKRYVGVEISDAAVDLARERFADSEHVEFYAMDTMHLAFEDRQFDTIIAKDILEYLPEPLGALTEAYRVLRDGGRLIVASPNRDSLHLLVNRMLGHADFLSSYDHIKEYSFSEVCDMLKKAGFSIAETGGVFLQPYWGIPGIDNHIRYYTDNDPDMVELLRQLGERAGAEYAFCFIIVGEKPATH